MSVDISPLPPAPAGLRFRPVDALAIGDEVVEIGSARPRRGRVSARGRLDDLLAAAGRALVGTDDVGVAVTWDDGQSEPYAHARHLVDAAAAERLAVGTDLPALALCGVVRLALCPA